MRDIPAHVSQNNCLADLSSVAAGRQTARDMTQTPEILIEHTIDDDLVDVTVDDGERRATVRLTIEGERSPALTARAGCELRDLLLRLLAKARSDQLVQFELLSQSAPAGSGDSSSTRRTRRASRPET